MSGRVELSPARRTERTAADSLVLRLRGSRAGDVLLGSALRLRPLRRVFLRFATERAIAALNREDWEVFTANFASDVEYVMARRGGASAWAGADDMYRGRDGVERFHRAWAEDWGGMEHEPVALYDQGERVIFLAEMRGAGRASGAAATLRYAAVNDLDRRTGTATRVRFFLDWDEALRETGIEAQ